MYYRIWIKVNVSENKAGEINSYTITAGLAGKFTLQIAYSLSHMAIPRTYKEV
jgi:hypothetical protein